LLFDRGGRLPRKGEHSTLQSQEIRGWGRKSRKDLLWWESGERGTFHYHGGKQAEAAGERLTLAEGQREGESWEWKGRAGE